MRLDCEWNNFMLETINPSHAKTARQNRQWRHVVGNLYQSEDGENHACDSTCIRWVYRKDGLRICAISGLCKNSFDVKPPEQGHLKRRGRNDTDEMGNGGPPCAPEEAIAMAEHSFGFVAPPPCKKQSFHSEMAEMTDTDMDMGMEEYASMDGAAAKPSSDMFEPSYGAGNYCNCSGSASKNASHMCCGMHY